MALDLKLLVLDLMVVALVVIILGIVLGQLELLILVEAEVVLLKNLHLAQLVDQA